MCTHAFAVDVEPQKLTPVPIQKVTIRDEFWSPKRKVWSEVTINDCFNKFERDGALKNFDRVRDGKRGGHAGPPWYAGLIYEMIRAASDFLAVHYDPELDKRLDGYIARIAAAAAKDPDGYINTWTQLEEPTHRWGLNGGYLRWQHEVYNAGALVDAGVHHYLATRKTNLLKIAIKFANHMCDLMGPPPKKNIVPTHSGPEEAVVKLYLLFRNNPELKKALPLRVDEDQYLKLTEFWIENRGNHCGKPDWQRMSEPQCAAYIRSHRFGEERPSWGSYAQDHKPVLQQETIEGHAVRATLLCTGLAATARVNGRDDYLRAARRLWENMVRKRMHITGGAGAFAYDEKFGPDYVLPNSAHLETCAAVGAGFFHHHMNMAFANAQYADELERVLYNGVLCGVSLKGDTYFYQNPLEAGTKRTRWSWHGCPCCPPMFLKIMGAMPSYIYAYDEDGIYVNLFVGSRATVPFSGTNVTLKTVTRYPWEGGVKVTVEPEKPMEFDLNVRIPYWCDEPTLRINSQPVDRIEMVRGYARIHRAWKSGDVVELSMLMPIRRMKAHPRVEADIGRVALMRGPVVYCLEGVDNGGHVRHLSLPRDTELIAEHRPDLLGGVTVIRGTALAVQKKDWGNSLYQPLEKVPNVKPVEFLAVPYFANANRGPAEMIVWIPDSPDGAEPAPLPTIASRARPSASHCNRGDTVGGMNDQIEPKDSADTSIPRFTWWDHKGAEEWVQYDFDKPRRVSSRRGLLVGRDSHPASLPRAAVVGPALQGWQRRTGLALVDAITGKSVRIPASSADPKRIDLRLKLSPFQVLVGRL